MPTNYRSYNKYFNATTNQQIDDLIKSMPNKKAARINRKNGDSSLDIHYAYIQEKLSEKKSQAKIVYLINSNFGLGVVPSTMSRFISKRLKNENSQ